MSAVNSVEGRERWGRREWRNRLHTISSYNVTYAYRDRQCGGTQNGLGGTWWQLKPVRPIATIVGSGIIGGYSP